MGIDALTHGLPWSAEYLPRDARAGYVPTMRGRLDWLERLEPNGPEVRRMIERLTSRRLFLDPTLIAYVTKFRGDEAAASYAIDRADTPPVMVGWWKTWTFTSDWSRGDYARGHRLWPKVLDMIRRYHQAGVRLTTGSDLPNPWVGPGGSLHSEMALLVSAGIPIADVLRMATSEGAAALGLDRELGTIESGKIADAVWLGDDPLADIRHTRAIRGVLKDGRWAVRKR
jgi:hypothetical protein